MEFENFQATKKVKLWLIRMPLLALLIILVLTLLEIFPSAIWLIISAGVFVACLLIVLIGRLHYIKFSSKDGEILIRHYHLFPLITDYQELIIQRSDNPEFVLKPSIFGLVPILYVNIHTSQGKAVYPPVPLSLLSRKVLKKIFSELGVK